MAKAGRPKGKKTKNIKISADMNGNLWDKLNKYVETLQLNEVKNSKGNQIKRPDVLNEMLSQYLKNIVTSNKNFLKFSKPFYINMADLNKNRFVEAQKELSLSEIDETVKVLGMYNNLDTFNTKFKSYCAGNNPLKHKGIYIKLMGNIEFDEFIIKDISHKCYLMEYNDGNLNISLITLEDLQLILDYDSFYYITNNFNNEYNYIKSLENNNFRGFLPLDLFFDLVIDESIFFDVSIKKIMNIENPELNKEIDDLLYIDENNNDFMGDISEIENYKPYEFTKAIFNDNYSIVKLFPNLKM